MHDRQRMTDGHDASPGALIRSRPGTRASALAPRPNILLALQRLVGNGAVSQLFRRSLLHRGPVDLMVQRFFDPSRLTVKEIDGFSDAIDYIVKNHQAIRGAYDETMTLIAGRQDKPIKAYDNHGDLIKNLSELTPYNRKGMIGKKRNEITQLVSLLNMMEQEALTRRVISRGPASATVLLGTEFTFVDDDFLSGLIPSREKLEQKTPDKQKQAEDLLLQWRGSLFEGMEVCESSEKVGTLKKIIPVGTEKTDSACVFHYDLGSGKDQGTWWWRLDLDVGCIETQTKPSTRDQYATVAPIMDQHIFALAKDVFGLRVDFTAAGGGGHISLDAATALGGSAEILLRLLLRLQTSVDGWKEYFKYNDPHNSPWIREQGHPQGDPLEPFVSVVKGLQERVAAGGAGVTEVASAVSEFNKSLVNRGLQEDREQLVKIESFLSKKGKVGGERKVLEADKKRFEDRIQWMKDHVDHYQAVNIEHLFKEGEEARIELRDIGAQTGVEKVLGDMDFILTTLSEEWGNVDRSQRERNA